MTSRLVVPPERFKEVVVDPLEKTREMLFVGAIMNIVDSCKSTDDHSIHDLAQAARENIAKVAHEVSKSRMEDDPRPTMDPVLSSEAKVAATRAFLQILTICGKLDINVAIGALRLHHEDKKLKQDVQQKGAE